MIPALTLIHLANLIEFSLTTKDGFLLGANGFYVYSQSGLGDLSKVRSSIRKGRKMKRMNIRYIWFEGSQKGTGVL